MSGLPREPVPGQPLSPHWGIQIQRVLQELMARPAGLRAAPARPARASGGSSPQPFDCSVSGTDLTLRPGTINEVVPSNMFSTLVLPGGSYTRYIVLTASCSGGQVSSAALSVDLSAPGAPAVAAGSPPTSFKVLLAIVVDGVAYRTIGAGSLSARPVEAYRVDKASPTYGLSPYDIYYTWQRTENV